MGALLLGLAAAGLVYFAKHDGPLASGDGKSASPKAKGTRRMNSQEAFLAGKKARDEELELEAKERKAFESKVDAAVEKRIKADKPAPVKTEKPAPVETTDGDGDTAGAEGAA